MVEIITRLFNLWKNDAFSFVILTPIAAFGIYWFGSAICLWNEVSAAWVQAIGSVVAIVASFRIAKSGYERESNERKQNEISDRYEHLASVYAVVENAGGLISSAADVIQESLSEELRRFHCSNLTPKLKIAWKALDDIPVHQLGDHALAGRLIAVRAIVSDCIQALHDYAELPESAYNRLALSDLWRSEVSVADETFYDRLTELANKLG